MPPKVPVHPKHCLVQKKKKVMMGLQAQGAPRQQNLVHWILNGLIFTRRPRPLSTGGLLKWENPLQRRDLTTMRAEQQKLPTADRGMCISKTGWIQRGWLVFSYPTNVCVTLPATSCQYIFASQLNAFSRSVHSPTFFLLLSHVDSRLPQEFLVGPGARKVCFSQFQPQDIRHCVAEFWELEKVDQDSLATRCG